MNIISSMRLSDPKLTSSKMYNYNINQVNNLSTASSDVFIKNNETSPNLKFTAKPWVLPQIQIKDSYDAIAMYESMKVGNYLDSSDDDVSPANKLIRQNNLSFLDKIKTKKVKKDFINYYEKLTGFPDLEKVSKRIEQEFIIGVKKSSIGIEGGRCIAAGYDETCSVGKRRAFPGSDLDKAFIILEGVGDDDKDKEIVSEFKGNLWENVDQRILSFNHDISFPSVYTRKQVLDNIQQIDIETDGLVLDRDHLKKLMNEEYVDLEKASEYNIAVSNSFPTDSTYMCDMSKQDVKNFGYFIESFRDGKMLINTKDSNKLKKEIEDYDFYNFSNVAQIKAMKNAIYSGRENKTKILIREDLPEKFNKWDTNQQFDFVKTLIKYSCEDNDKYKEYFTNDRNVKDAYKPLLNILTRGDRYIYNRVEFKDSKNSLNMKYGEDKYVDLFNGYKDNVLWVDSDEAEAIKQVNRNIDKIKQNDKFKKVDRIQCPSPKGFVKDFIPTGFKTTGGVVIYEKRLY